MDRAVAFDIVTKAIASQFSVSIDSITEDTVAIDVAGWDSFSNGLLVMALEDATHKPLPFDDLASANNVGEMIDIIAMAV